MEMILKPQDTLRLTDAGLVLTHLLSEVLLMFCVSPESEVSGLRD